MGHGAVLHCCTVRRNALIGMNAVVMDGATVGESAFVAACSFVKAGFVIPPRSLAAGILAKVIRQLTPAELAWKPRATGLYQHLTQRSLASIVETYPLAAPQDNRGRIAAPSVLPLSETKRR